MGKSKSETPQGGARPLSPASSKSLPLSVAMGLRPASSASAATPASAAQLDQDDGQRLDRRVVRTRKAIRKAFFDLVEQQDYQKITIAAIAREADVDRKTFYLHYDSVDSLMDTLVREEADRIVAACRRYFQGNREMANVAELFTQIAMGIAPDIVRSRRVVSHLPYELVVEKLERSLTTALIEDDFLGLSSMGPYLPYCVSFFSAGLVAVCHRWLFEESDIALEDISQLTRTAAMSGIEGVLASAGLRPAE